MSERYVFPSFTTLSVADEIKTQQRRVQSPSFERRSTCPYPQPELVQDFSTPASDADSAAPMDVDMDDDGHGAADAVEIRHNDGYRVSAGYSFGNGGSGGFGFGPGAEEDEEEIAIETPKNRKSALCFP